MSGRRCSICSRPDRPEVDAAIVSGEAKRGIARRFAVSPDAVERHARGHLPAAIVKAKEAEDVANGDALLRQIQSLQITTLAILTAAEKDDPRTALGAIHQARENVAFLSKLLAELKPPATENRGLLALIAAETGSTEEEILLEVGKLNKLAADPVALERAIAAARDERREREEALGTRIRVEHVSVTPPKDTAPESEPEKEPVAVVVPAPSGFRKVGPREWILE